MKINSRSLQEKRDFSELLGHFFVLGLSIVVFSFYGLDLPLPRDNSIYMYAADKLAEGVMPYKSIFDIKAPATTIVASIFVKTAEVFGLDHITGVRLGFIGLVILTILLTYHLAVKFYSRHWSAIAAPVAMLSFYGYLFHAAAGVKRKRSITLTA